ncbi:MAG: PQQ-dependent sugar dehydrogenase [Planctomycetes bacterium]|nr:PQQ-dependent sugar dehydrogenase [Planctomycetota bacterium]
MVQAFPGLDFDRPLWIGTPPDKSRRLFVVEQGGCIYSFKPATGARNADLFLDVSGRVYRGHNEEGLLALAFHPKYAENGFLYVWFSAKNPRRHVLARFTAKDDRADPGSEFIILQIEKPYGNHNGSTLLFGSDGFLYFSVGDGGSGGDPHRNGQDLSGWLAKIHRIDVDGRDPGKNYAVPKDNPFVKLKDARPETWAFGLRNVWRMSFDRKTGDLWAGDVGQNKYEEVDVVTKGGNYGWRIREGSHPFSNDRTESTLLDPVIEYGTEDGHSVTGGYVYRGEKLKRLQGAYVYADYVSGKIWALRWDGKKVTAWREILHQPKNIASFGEDADGELYLCVFDGRIYRLEEL